jgi:hypothetical protein
MLEIVTYQKCLQNSGKGNMASFFPALGEE